MPLAPAWTMDDHVPVAAWAQLLDLARAQEPRAEAPGLLMRAYGQITAADPTWKAEVVADQ